MAGDTRTLKVIVVGSAAGARAALANLDGGLESSRFKADLLGGKMSSLKTVLGTLGAVGAAVGLAELSKKFVGMAGDFEVQMTRVRTGAGELASNMKMVGNGVLSMAGDVGQTTGSLTSALYMVESAGYHGADALSVLRTSAMGAKVGAAELATTADAVTTAMNAYGMKAGDVTHVMNALIATEASGKTNLEALAGSMSGILPTAAAAHVGLTEVLAAMATMTSEGTPAAVAATYLRQVIGQLSNPSAKAAAEMKSLGLNATQVSLSLGRNGLAATLTMLTDAIQNKMGPAGTVLIKHLQAAATNTTAYQKVLANLPPAQQTYIGALATMVGGTKSMQAALQLTGPHMAVFQANVVTIAEHVKAGGNAVEGWADVQKNFNQKVAEAKATVEALGIKIGQFLLPWMSKVLTVVMDTIGWFIKHKEVTKDLATTFGMLVGAFVLYKTTVMSIVTITKLWILAQKLLTAEFWAFDAATSANWIGLIVVAIAALVLGVIYAYKHFAWFRTAVQATWLAIQIGAKAVGAAAVWLWQNAILPAFNGIVAAAKWVAAAGVTVWHALVTAFNAIITAAKAVGAAGMWLWNNALKPAFNAIAKAAVWLYTTVLRPAFMAWIGVVSSVGNFLKSVFMLIVDLIRLILMPVFMGIVSAAKLIGAAAVWLYQNALRPAFDGIVVAVKAVGAAAVWLYQNAILPAATAIAALWNWLYARVLKPGFDLFMMDVRMLGAIFSWLYANGIHPAVTAIAAVWDWLWSKGSSVFSATMGIVGKVGDTFRSVFSSIGGWIASAFSTAVGTVKSNINTLIWLINTAVGFINKNVIDVADKLPGVSFGHIPSIPMLASGGRALRNVMHLVGERGPELFVPDSSGTVISNNRLAGMSLAGAGLAGASSGDVNVTVNVAGNVTAEKDLAKAISTTVRDEIARKGKRNGGRTGF